MASTRTPVMTENDFTIDEPDSDANVGKTCELRIRQQRYDRHGNQEEVVVQNLKLPRGHGQDKEYAITVSQIFDKKNRLEKEVLTINSDHLLLAFREVIGEYPTVASDFSEPFEMESPFQMLYHKWGDLDTYREEIEDDVARMHLNLLFDFLDTSTGAEKRKCEGQARRGQIDFKRAWTIFKPGDILLKSERGQAWLLKCTKTAYEESASAGPYLEVHCVYTDYDGTDLGEAILVPRIYQKKSFASEHPATITDLPVYPRRFYHEGESVEKRLHERGAKFLSLRETCTRHCEGLAEYLKQPPNSFFDPDMSSWPPVWIAYKETGRIIIDRKTFQDANTIGEVDRIVSEDKIDKSLCPPFVMGFSLATKEWCRFYIQTISDIDWDLKSMDNLVLKEDAKSILHALVSSHHFPDNPRDQTKQKGKGLVVLLHGAPGSGKTLTAECCAEITRRPLLSTSLAELNKENYAWYFEQRLVQVLQYATIWKSVVLMDEADVFLECRKDDVADAAERNSLVAIFLRHLEYFSGIVFLTTNRVHVFDEAMKSRIHLALGYDPPGLEMRKTLWTKKLKAAIGGDLDAEVEEALDVISRNKLNGREISNVINTAQTLARYENIPLHLKHIEQVLNVRKEFDRGLLKMASDAKRTSVGPIARQGSILGAMCEEPEDLE